MGHLHTAANRCERGSWTFTDANAKHPNLFDMPSSVLPPFYIRCEFDRIVDTDQTRR